jgi:hypothetical protein
MKIIGSCQETGNNLSKFRYNIGLANYRVIPHLTLSPLFVNISVSSLQVVTTVLPLSATGNRNGGCMSVGSLRIGVPSPTASSLGKFGDIPVSLYTGLPDIEIPLYTVNLTALKRYNQSGSLMHNYTYTYYSGTNRLQRRNCNQ